MRLLITTQAVDIDDPVLGFFHRWIEEFAKHCEHITVVCLREGKHHLPSNVEVLSLGKEEGTSRFARLRRFYSYIVSKRNEYDVVLVHMNQEYVLLGGILWRLFGKRIYMWRNHGSGSLFTKIAVAFCTKVFCTSRFSYTAKYTKTILMPVGIDTQLFKPNPAIAKISHSILFLGRIAPSKHPDIFIEALGVLQKKNVEFSADIYGDALPQDLVYYENLKKRVVELELGGAVSFHSGVPNYQTPTIYNAHELYVNVSDPGMLDKTIFEAMACGMPVAISNQDLLPAIGQLFVCNQGNATALAENLMQLLAGTPEARLSNGEKLRHYVLAQHSLAELGVRLYNAML